MRYKIFILIMISTIYNKFYSQSAWKNYDTLNSGLKSNLINQILSDSKGNTWFATDKGLAKFDGISWTNYNTKNCGIADDNVSKIAFDKNGILWVGTYKGLCKFDGLNWTIHNQLPNGDKVYYITHLEIDLDGNIWCGTDTRGVFKFDKEFNYTLFHLNTEIKNRRIYSLKIDSRNQKWVMYLDENDNIVKLCMFDNTSWKYYNTSNKDLGSRSVVDLVVDSENNKWITTQNGFFKVDTNDEFKLYNTSNSGIASNLTYKVRLDSKGAKWITTNKGLCKFENEKWTVFDSLNSKLPYNNLWNIVIDSFDNKWITYYDDWFLKSSSYGLTKYDNLTWITYNNSNSGLPSNYISLITIDNYGNKWISSYDKTSSTSGINFQSKGVSKLVGNGSSILCESPLNYNLEYFKSCQNENKSYVKINSSLNQSVYSRTIEEIGSNSVDYIKDDSIIIRENGRFKLKIYDDYCFTDTVMDISIQNLEIPEVNVTLNSSSSFCRGDSVILNSSLGQKYLWSTGDTSSFITVKNSGSYQVELTDVNGCKNKSNIVKTIVFDLPLVEAKSSKQMLCVDEDVVLTGFGASTYVWDKNVINGIPFIPNANQTYTVIGLDSNGCSNKASISIKVNEKPNVFIYRSGNSSACKGDLELLTSNTGVSYLWSNGEITSNIYPSISGEYYLKLIDSNGCEGYSNSIKVAIYSLPEVSVTINGPISYCKTNLTELVASNGVSYLWNDGSTTKTIKPTQSGLYFVKITGENECTASSEPIYITVNDCSSIEELNFNLVRVYPNPTLSQLSIEIPFEYINLSYKLIDVAGKELVNGKLTTLINSLDVHSYSSGAYFFEIENGYKMKIIKE